MTREPLSQAQLLALAPGPGDLVAGKYRIARELGRGGMGIVFEATNVLTEHRFALKWLSLQGDDNDEGLQRFMREAKLAGRVHHPHVIDVYDIQFEKNRCFLVMELLAGESLAKRLSRVGPLSVNEAREILLPCLAGLGAAHAMGVIHRDIKPDNIFLCCTDAPDMVSPKILDFGISRSMRSGSEPQAFETRKGVLVGTPAYMAPEQLRSKPCDRLTDVYGLGVTLYEMLSGEHPFSAETYPELITQILEGDATPLRTYLPEIPQAVADLVLRAMHREPSRRFPDVDAFRSALLALEAPETQTGRRLKTVQTMVLTAHGSGGSLRTARRWSTLAIGVLLAISAGGLLLAREHKRRPTLQAAAPIAVQPSVRSALNAIADPQPALEPIAPAKLQPPATEPSAQATEPREKDPPLRHPKPSARSTGLSVTNRRAHVPARSTAIDASEAPAKPVVQPAPKPGVKPTVVIDGM